MSSTDQSDAFADGKETELKKKEYIFKVIVVGDAGTGKTTFIQRYVHNYFSLHYKSTIGVDFALKEVPLDGHTNIKLSLWDIAGQERFGNMIRVFYKEAVGALVVFDVTRPHTFEAVKNWKKDIDEKVHIPGTDKPIPVVLLANKIDLDRRWLSKTKEQMDEFCVEFGFAGWFETSAKDNINIDKPGNFLIHNILANETVCILEKPDIIKVGETPAQPQPWGNLNCNSC